MVNLVVLDIVWTLFDTHFQAVHDCLGRAEDRGSGLVGYMEFGRLVM